MGESAELLLLKNWVRVRTGKNREENVPGHGNSVFKGPKAGKSSIKDYQRVSVAGAHTLGESGLRQWGRGGW